MRTLTLDPMPQPDDRHERELMELLKTSAKDTPPETNERDTRTDKAEVYRDPPGYPKPGDGKLKITDAFQDLYQDSRAGLIGRVLSSKEQADRVAQQTIAQNLAHGAAGQFESRAAVLESASNTKLSHQPALTLSERVRTLR